MNIDFLFNIYIILSNFYKLSCYTECMKRLLLLIIMLSMSMLSLGANEVNDLKLSANKVYRSDRMGDSYHFLLLNNKGEYFYLLTNKADKLTPSELSSPKLLTILKKKQSWGKAFQKSGTFTVKNKKIYTKRLWNRIKIISPKEIKYLNKTFYLQ